jgi:hypothetical protein
LFTGCIGTSDEAAKKLEKQIPRGLKPARGDKNKGLNGTTKEAAEKSDFESR